MIGACRVMGRYVEGVEVMEIVLDFGALGHRKTQLAKQGFNAADGTGDRMQATGRLAASGQADVQGLGRQLSVQFGQLQGIALAVEGIVDDLFGMVDGLAGGGALLGRKPTEGLGLFGKNALFTHVTDPDFIQFDGIGGSLDLRLCLDDHVFQLIHVFLVDLPVYTDAK